MGNLWSNNSPDKFWRCLTEISMEVWDKAIQSAAPLLKLDGLNGDIDALLLHCLGEEQFGSKHWQMSIPMKTYYMLKPFMPRNIKKTVRQAYSDEAHKDFRLDFPIESRFVNFLWETMRYALVYSGQNEIDFIHFWPHGEEYALILTHDIETEEGLNLLSKIIELESSLEFRSSFNLVPELYPIDQGLVDELRESGFEIGIHGLRHDGKLYFSENEFLRRAEKINQYIKKYGAAGFRSPLTLRNPQWMQALEIEYDLSFFDTDPYEPKPGGTMCIYPFQIGHFIELPYTLMQDSTLLNLLNETTPQLWLDKIEFIRKYHGMALVNTHPDYLSSGRNWRVYREFLENVRLESGYWHGLPRDAAKWWRKRMDAHRGDMPDEAVTGKVFIEDQKIHIHKGDEK